MKYALLLFALFLAGVSQLTFAGLSKTAKGFSSIENAQVFLAQKLSQEKLFNSCNIHQSNGEILKGFVEDIEDEEDEEEEEGNHGKRKRSNYFATRFNHFGDLKFFPYENEILLKKRSHNRALSLRRHLVFEVFII